MNCNWHLSVHVSVSVSLWSHVEKPVWSPMGTEDNTHPCKIKPEQSSTTSVAYSAEPVHVASLCTATLRCNNKAWIWTLKPVHTHTQTHTQTQFIKTHLTNISSASHIGFLKSSIRLKRCRVVQKPISSFISITFPASLHQCMIMISGLLFLQLGWQAD